MGLLERATMLALRKITQYGEPCVWQSAGAPVASDPTKPWIVAPADPNNVPVPIFYPMAGNDPFFKLIAGSEVDEGKQKGLMPAQAFIPQAGDTIVRSDGSKLQLESANQLAPNGVVIMWSMVFKR